MGRITTRLDEEPLAVYRQLEHVSPDDRAKIVLDLITRYGRLDLPARDGLRANLYKIDLSRDSLKTRLERGQRNPAAAWWDNKRQRANLQGANLQGAFIEDANLQWIILVEADLQKAIFWGADLHDADLKNANLQQADFSWADLEGTSMTGANLQRACLRNTKLRDVDLTSCNLTEAYMEFAYLGRTLLRAGQLGRGIGEEVDKNYVSAKRAYRILKKNFEELGNYEPATWAYIRERLMEKMETWTEAQQAIKNRKWFTVIAKLFECTNDQIVEWTCGYGESIGRVLVTLTLLLVVSAALYGVFGAVVYADGTYLAFPRDWANLIVFSLNTMTNTDLGHLAPVDDPLAHLAQGVQTLFAIFLTGLLGFVVGNRIRRS